MHQIKDLNQLEPVCITERKINKALERKLKFPKNPNFQVDELFKSKNKNIKQKESLNIEADK